jgi:hypothetical protein
MLKSKLIYGTVVMAVLSVPMIAEELKGRVFEDTNKNGVYDKDTDLRLKDVNVTVTDAKGTIVTVKTNKNGVYKVKGISVGEALIAIDEATLPGINPVQVVGINPSTKNVQAGKANWSGKDGYTFDSLYGKVCGDVFLDEKSIVNNVFNRGEEMVNATVNITEENGKIHNTTTDASGRYCVSDVAVGISTIWVNGNEYYQGCGISSYEINKINVVHINKTNEAPVIKMGLICS